MALYDTVLNVVSDASVEIGLGTVSAVFASTDPNVIQLRTILKRLGKRLTLRRQWRQLRKEHTFVTTSDTEYDFPTDFGAFIDQTGWNRTQGRSLHVASPQEWQYLKATQSGTTYTAIFRPYATTLELWPQPPTSGDTIAFEYISRNWVALTGTDTPNKDAPTLDTDVLLFDSLLLVGALKLAFKKAKGFDVTADMMDFAEEWGLAESANSSAPVLSLNSFGMNEKLLDESNAPTTGFGFDGLGGLF